MLRILIETEHRKIQIEDKLLSEESTWVDVLPLFEDILKAMGYQLKGTLAMIDREEPEDELPL